jgi:hypothetical protein
MSAEVFHRSTCPLCGGTANSIGGRFNGRLICPYCHSSIVVSVHGQFVRDPFKRKPLISIQQLRRQSQPLSRLLRDVQSPLRLLVGGLVILTIGSLTWQNYTAPTSSWPIRSRTGLEQAK